MRVVVQRVTRAAVDVLAGEAFAGPVDASTRSIGPGLCVLAGFTEDDTRETAAWMAAKLAGLRVFADAAGISIMRPISSFSKYLYS